MAPRPPCGDDDLSVNDHVEIRHDIPLGNELDIGPVGLAIRRWNQYEHHTPIMSPTQPNPITGTTSILSRLDWTERTGETCKAGPSRPHQGVRPHSHEHLDAAGGHKDVEELALAPLEEEAPHDRLQVQVAVSKKGGGGGGVFGEFLCVECIHHNQTVIASVSKL